MAGHHKYLVSILCFSNVSLSLASNFEVKMQNKTSVRKLRDGSGACLRIEGDLFIFMAVYLS